MGLKHSIGIFALFLCTSCIPARCEENQAQIPAGTEQKQVLVKAKQASIVLGKSVLAGIQGATTAIIGKHLYDKVESYTKHDLLLLGVALTTGIESVNLIKSAWQSAKNKDAVKPEIPADSAKAPLKQSLYALGKAGLAAIQSYMCYLALTDVLDSGKKVYNQGWYLDFGDEEHFHAYLPEEMNKSKKDLLIATCISTASAYTALKYGISTFQSLKKVFQKKTDLATQSKSDNKLK